MRISMIAALGAKNRAIGKDNQLLWHIPDDLKRFKALTMGHPVIMGRKTWESLPEKFRPLPGRENIIVTRNQTYSAEEAVTANSLEEALAKAESVGTEETFIIGGAQLYEQALPRADRLYLTLVDSDDEGDVFFPPYKNLFTAKIGEESRSTDNGLHYRWLDLRRE